MKQDEKNKKEHKMRFYEDSDISPVTYKIVKNIFKVILLLTYDVSSYKLENLDEIDFKKGFIMAANHGSIVDAFVMGLEVNKHRVRFLGRQRTLWSNPIFAKINNVVGTIPVPERTVKNKNVVVEAAVASLKKGDCLGIFPEGAILNRRKKFEGKTGTARMALEAEVPIVPVGLIGTNGLWPYGAKIPRLGRPVEMYVGKPLYFDEYHGMQNDFPTVRKVTDIMMKEIRVESGWWDVPATNITEHYEYYKKKGI